MPADDTPAGDLDEAERLVRQFAETGQHPGRPAVAAMVAEYDRLRRENRELIADEHELTQAQAEAKDFRDQLRGSIGRANDWRDTALEVSRQRDEELARVRDLEAELVAVRSQLDRVRRLADQMDEDAVGITGHESQYIRSAATELRAVLDGQEDHHG